MSLRCIFGVWGFGSLLIAGCYSSTPDAPPSRGVQQPAPAASSDVWNAVPGSGMTAKSPVSRSAASNLSTPHDDELVVASWVSVPDLPRELALLPSVFWEPEDTTSLRAMIRNMDLVSERRILEVGTGSGLVALCCLQFGAAHVVATDINPSAVRNAALNARRLGFETRMETRLVPRRSPGAWTVVRPDEQFDLIISNPPWENERPAEVREFALYDPGFQLLESLMTGARSHLKPGGRMLLAYGCGTAIRKIREIGAAEQLSVTILDDRQPDDLPDVFLPGMLIEIRVP